MADGGAEEEYETATDHAAAKGNQVEGIDYLERFSALIEPGKTILDAGCGDGLPVDAYLVKHGFAVNGIDASARVIERARRNVPEGFFEVKDMVDLVEGEYCVDGVVSLRAMVHISPERYRPLIKTFASFMPSGGALLLTVRSDERGRVVDHAHGTMVMAHQDNAGDITEVLDDAGFTIIVKEIAGLGDEKHEIILARS